MKQVLKLLILSDIILFTSFGFIASIFAIFVEGGLEGGGIAAAGIASSIYFLTRGGMQIPCGRLADRYGRKQIVIIGTALITFVLLGYHLMKNIIHLFILEVIHGLGAALSYPAWLAIFSENLKRGSEGYEWSIYYFFVDICGAIAAFSGGILAEIIGFRLLFLSGFLASCISLALLFFIDVSDIELLKRKSKITKFVGGLILDKGKLLMVKKKDKHYLPGGEVKMEELDSGALLETVGDDLEKNVKLVDIIHFKRYEFTIKSKQVRIETYICKPSILPKSSQKFKWIQKKDIPTIKFSPIVEKIIPDLIKSRLIR